MKSTPEYLTVSQAAAALKISERTVQRRCKSGKLGARQVTTETGQAWEVDAATLPTGADRVTTPFEREPIAADKLPTGDAIAADRVTTGADSAKAVQIARMQGFMAGQMETAIARAISAANAPLLDEIRLLRAEIEAMKTSAYDAPGTPQSGETGKEAQTPKSVAQRNKAREVQPLQRFVARVFGLRIRELEK